MKKTISIAGGGLAGLSLGIALRRHGVPVVLHEAGTYPRHRVCGEFISGVTDSTLENLGISSHLHDAIPLSAARWYNAGGLLGEVSVSARGISRWLLDERLRQDFVTSGGELHLHSRIQPAPGTVWAAGRLRRPGSWIGLKFHATNLTISGDLEMHAGINGYVGLAKIENHRINICGLFRARSNMLGKGHALFLEFLRAGGLYDLAHRLSRSAIDESSFCGTAGFQLGRQSDGPSFSIGDAANMIPPFTGNGMTMAFESAECALEPLLEFSSGNFSWKEAAATARRTQNLRFQKRLAMAGWMHAILATPLGIRLASALALRRMVPYQFLLRLIR